MKRQAALFTGLILLVLASGCAVVKTRYTESGYYRDTVTRLDSLESKMSVADDQLLAGFSKVNLTPSLNHKVENPEKGEFRHVPLAGFGARKGKNATAVHDSIFVRAVSLKAGDKFLVIISPDLLIMPPNLADSVINNLRRSGLKRDQIFFSATHTHSSLGGWAYGIVGKQFAGKKNAGVQRWLTGQVTKAALLSITDMRAAEAGTAGFDASRFIRNRLPGSDGIINGNFRFISIKQFNGRNAVIGSFAAHATTLGAGNMELSADYPGYWERKLEGKAADVAAFCAGSTGSQAAVSEGDSFERPKYLGEALADSVMKYLPGIKMSSKMKMDDISLKMDLPEYHFRLSGKRNLPAGLSRMLMKEPENVYLQALRINNLLWIFTPGDFSADIATGIRYQLAVRGFTGMTTSFNGSYIGYITPGKYFYINNYETKLMGWYGPYLGDYVAELIRSMCNALTR